IAGNINPTETKKMIQKYFGDIKRGGHTIKRPENNEPIRTKEKKEVFYDETIQMPAIVFSYPAPALKSKDEYAMKVAMHILGGGENSKLYRKLVEEEQISVYSGGAVLGLEHTGL